VGVRVCGCEGEILLMPDIGLEEGADGELDVWVSDLGNTGYSDDSGIEPPGPFSLQLTATLCNCDTLQHTATHCNIRQHTATYGNALQHTATHCNTRQHTATHGNTRQHKATHKNMGYLDDPGLEV